MGGVDELQQRKLRGSTGHSIKLAFVTSDIPLTQRLPQKDCSPCQHECSTTRLDLVNFVYCFEETSLRDND